MKYHIVKITKENTTYLADYSRNGNYETWSDNVEDWREFGKKEAKDITHRFKLEGTDARLEKDIGI